MYCLYTIQLFEASKFPFFHFSEKKILQLIRWSLNFYFPFHLPGYLLNNHLNTDVVPNEVGLRLNTWLIFESLGLKEY